MKMRVDELFDELCAMRIGDGMAGARDDKKAVREMGVTPGSAK